MKKFLAFAVVAACAANAFAAEYFVNASTGADTNNGLTPATAVKTINQGITLSGAGDKVTVAAGT